MKNSLQKSAALFMAVIMVLTLFVTATFADGNENSGTCGENLTWSYDSNTKTLTISGTGNMEDYSLGGGAGSVNLTTAPWKHLYNYAKTLVIEEGVTNIGDAAFLGFIELTSVTIPNTVTNIKWRALSCCTSLTKISIPGSVKNIGREAFFGSGLESITIPDSISDINAEAFCDCIWLKEVTIGKSVRLIGYKAFNNCHRMEKVAIPASVEMIDDYAFYGCSDLKDVYYDGESIENIEIGDYNDCLLDAKWHFGNEDGSFISMIKNFFADIGNSISEFFHSIIDFFGNLF